MAHGIVLSSVAVVIWSALLGPALATEPKVAPLETTPAAPSVPQQEAAVPRVPLAEVSAAATPAADVTPPVTPIGDTASIARPFLQSIDRRLFVVDARTRQPLDRYALPEPVRLLLELGDIVYVAHGDDITVINLRSRARHLLRTSLSNWTWQLQGHHLQLQATDGRTALYDIANSAEPRLVRGPAPLRMPVAAAPDHALASAPAPPTPQSTADVPVFRDSDPPRPGNRGSKLLPTGIVFDVIGLALFGAGIGMLDNPRQNCGATPTAGYRCMSSYSEAVSIGKAMSSIPFAIGAAHLVVGITLTAVGAVRYKPRAAR